MKPTLLLAAVALAVVPLLCSADQPSMKFWSRGQEAGSAVHQLYPYRIGSRMMVMVHDPIICGQVPNRPHFSIREDQLILQYDLTEAPAGNLGRSCVAYSLFQIENLPDRSLQVSFAGGPEPVSVAQLQRCSSKLARNEERHCLVPSKREMDD